MSLMQACQTGGRGPHAAGIGIFIMQQFNNLAHFLNFYLRLCKRPNFELLKILLNIKKSF